MLWGLGSDVSAVRSDVGSTVESQYGSRSRTGSISGDDKRVNRILIKEKEEREEAIDSLNQSLKKLVKKEADERLESFEGLQKALRREEDERKNVVQEIHRSLEDLARKLELKPTESQHSVQASRTPTSRGIDDQQVREMRIAFEDRIAKQQKFIDENRRTLQQHAQQLEELYASTSTVEPRISSIEQIQRRMGAAATTNVPNSTLTLAPPSKPGHGGAGQHHGAGHHQGDLEVRLKEQDEQLTALRAQMVEERPEVVASFQARLKKIDEFQAEQAQHLTHLRALVVEVHMNLLLHAVKASRIALRCTDLSQEERQLALQSLDAKERLVQEDVAKISKKFEISGGNALFADLSGMNSTNGANPRAQAHDIDSPSGETTLPI